MHSSQYTTAKLLCTVKCHRACVITVKDIGRSVIRQGYDTTAIITAHRNHTLVSATFNGGPILLVGRNDTGCISSCNSSRIDALANGEFTFQKADEQMPAT